MTQLSFRLKPGQFLKEEIEKRTQDVKGGVILALVGALDRAVLRMAGATAEQQLIQEWNEDLEIVSATGTVSSDGCHIHVALSQGDGTVIGGHLKDGCRVKFTAEVVIGIFEEVTYRRVHNKETGFEELEVV